MQVSAGEAGLPEKRLIPSGSDILGFFRDTSPAMSFIGVHRALREAEDSVSPTELRFDVDLEIEDNSQEMWNCYSPIEKHLWALPGLP